jgi:hypothetical protein
MSFPKWTEQLQHLWFVALNTTGNLVGADSIKDFSKKLASDEYHEIGPTVGAIHDVSMGRTPEEFCGLISPNVAE